jgi:hypothetical protein
MKLPIKIKALCIFLIIFSKTAYCAEFHTKEWVVATFIDSFSKNQNLKYYIEPQLRLIDDPHVFNQAFILTGLGYQLTPAVTIFAGPGLIVTKNTEGQTYNEYRLWQQLNWQLFNDFSISLNSRTRLEEKQRSNQMQIAIQLRQRLWARIPIKNTNQYYYSLFDEVFFNLNHPRWVSANFFEKNRAFVGIAKQLTKNTMLDFGYLNQLQLGSPRQISHVLLLSFSITS